MSDDARQIGEGAYAFSCTFSRICSSRSCLALAWLGARGSAVTLGRRLRAIVCDGDWVTGLDWGDGAEPVAADPSGAVVAATVAANITPLSTIQNQEDAPPCSTCGSIMIRSGACYKCMNCGNTSGCA